MQKKININNKHQRAAKTVTKRAQELPKAAQDPIKTAQKPPQTVQRGPKSPQEWLKQPLICRFGVFLGLDSLIQLIASIQ